MATFRFELDHKPTRNNTYNLYLMVTVAKKRTKRKTGIQLAHIDDFNPSCKGNNWIRSRVPESKALNEQLRLMLVQANDTYNDLETKGEVSSNQIINSMNKEVVSPSFLKFAKDRTAEIEEEGGYRNMKKYNGLCNKLEAFMNQINKQDILMEDLTVEFLNRFKNFLHKWKNGNDKTGKRLLHPNTIEVQLNVLKTLVKRAVALGYISQDKNPFNNFTYKGVPTTKEKLDHAEIQKILKLRLDEGSLLWHVRNYFMFSFYCAGIRAGDLIQLRWCNVSASGRLTYAMDKNGKQRDLVLVPQALEILKLYRTESSRQNNYIFPLLANNAEYSSYITSDEKSTLTPELRKVLYSAVASKNALINKYLKKIAAMAGITKNLSFHIARHSFAKIAKETGLDSSIVKELLAHSKLATTEIYMGNFDTEKTDTALRNLFDHKDAEKDMNKYEMAASLLRDMTTEDIEMLKSIMAI